VQGETILVEHAPLPADDPDATLKPPQFALRTLLLIVSSLACLLAVMTAIGSLWSLAILLLLALVLAHVLGNAVGTKLRDRSVGRADADPAMTPNHPIPRRELLSPKRLTEPARLHWITLVLTGCGALAGGYFGGSALAASYPDATTAAVVLGVVSSGVLGGFAAFTASSFLTVARAALSEAHAASDRHQPRTSRRQPK
jgi:hypothetical protein